MGKACKGRKKGLEAANQGLQNMVVLSLVSRQVDMYSDENVRSEHNDDCRED